MIRRKIMKEVIRKFAESNGCSYEELISPSRKAILPSLRKVVSYELRERQWTHKKIGALLNRDHTTIISAIKSVNDLLSIRDEQISSLLKSFRSILDG